LSTTVISAEREVNASVYQAREWFLSLKDHPERYRFGTHEGIEFVEGNFGDVGGRFKTREKFHFLTLELLFELVEVDDVSFRFRLIRPAWMDVWGRFSMLELSPGAILLRIEIGSDTQRGGAWLKFSPVAGAIRAQITGEVDHIKESMESTV
jgi:hypothetical protein